MESVWDYPRPPRVEPSAARVVVELDGEVLADTRRSLRVLETSHPPVYYIPAADVRTERLRPSARRPTVCEFKGTARYYDAGDRQAELLAFLPVLRIGHACNAAKLVAPEADDGGWRVLGDPTEGALLVAARKAGLDREFDLRLRPVVRRRSWRWVRSPRRASRC